MRSLPELVYVGGVSFEVVVIRRVTFQGAEYDCRACLALKRFYVTAAAPLALQRRALARAIQQIRRMAAPHWQAA
jgi:hypothetical protein